MEELRTYVYATPTAEEKALEAWISLVGHYRSKHYESSRIRKDALLVYCIQGKGSVKMAHRTMSIQAGDLFLLPSHLHFHAQSVEGIGWDIWWLAYRGEYVEKLMPWVGLTEDNLLLHPGLSLGLISYFEKIFSLLEHKPPAYCLDASQALISLMIAVQKHKRETLSAEEQRFHTLNMKADNLDELAREMGYSKSHFVRIFKEKMGTTPWDYVLHLRVDKAKELLLNSRLSVKEIAFEIGFSNPLYFSRVFRKITGGSPSEFRQSWSNTRTTSPP